MGALDPTGKRILDDGLEECFYYKAIEAVTLLQIEKPNHPLVTLLLPCIEVDLGEVASKEMWEKLAVLYYHDQGSWESLSEDMRDAAAEPIFQKVLREINFALEG